MTYPRIAIVFIMVVSLFVGIAAASGAVGKVNINSASKEELMQLDGVGSAYAEKIIEYRETNGPFENTEDIMNVKGIGTSTFEKNKDRITVADDGEKVAVQQ